MSDAITIDVTRSGKIRYVAECVLLAGCFGVLCVAAVIDLWGNGRVLALGQQPNWARMCVAVVIFLFAAGWLILFVPTWLRYPVHRCRQIEIDGSAVRIRDGAGRALAVIEPAVVQMERSRSRARSRSIWVRNANKRSDAFELQPYLMPIRQRARLAKSLRKGGSGQVR